MRTQRNSTLAVGVIAVTCSAGAQPFKVTQSVVAGGGGTLSGGSYELAGTIGQAEAGQMLQSGSFELRGGFWTGWSSAARLCADQNGDGLVSPTDFSAWILNFNSMDPVADTNQDGFVTPADFTAWIQAYNQGSNGPLCDP